jgi:transcriptional regulator with XRE-family HTH domain
MVTKTKIERFYDDVKRLGLKFPGAEISRATGYKKGNVSNYLNRKLEPSAAFLEAFYKAFPVSYNSGIEKLSLAEEPGKAWHETVLEEVRQIRRSNDKLIDQQGLLVDTNSKLAERLLSLDSQVKTEEHYRNLQNLTDLVFHIGIASKAFRSEAEIVEVLNSIAAGKGKSSKAADRKSG